MKRIAITREVSDAIDRCELTHVARQPIDLELARAQHGAYEQALLASGCEIVRVEPAHGLPDAVFVEDTAVVLPEVAIVARPGAPSRRSEVPAIAEAIGRYRELRYVEAPGTLDGGDVLVAGRRVFVGRSGRTDDRAIAQVKEVLQPYGYEVVAVDVTGCLHLKSAATALSESQLLVNPAWIPREPFAGVELVEIDPREPHAANILRAGGDLIYPSAFPRTRDRLERRGMRLALVDLSELSKAEGAVTCCSVIFDAA